MGQIPLWKRRTLRLHKDFTEMTATIQKAEIPEALQIGFLHWNTPVSWPRVLPAFLSLYNDVDPST